MPHIEVRDVSLTYDTPSGPAVAGVAAASFDIGHPNFLCIVGRPAAASRRCST